MANNEELMKKCIELAERGRGNTSPNPMVGCVVLNSEGDIISEGYHHKYGENHAEREALLKITDGTDRGGTLIVNLEPCSHFGKTPPCADLIIERGIKKVVIGSKDNNPKVNGGGIKKLTDAGIEVVCGVLENECRKLNEVFFTDVEQNRIFVALKTATTLDGKIATKTGNSKWITSDRSRQRAKELRGYYDAILTSSSTVIADNPEMKHKLKIIIDREQKTDFNSNIYKDGKIILVTGVNSEKTLPDNVERLICPIVEGKIDLKYLMRELYNLGIKSVFVEAGGKLSGSFLKENLVDKIYQFIAPKVLNDNSGKSCFDGDNILKMTDSKLFKINSLEQIENDILVTYYPQNV